MDRDKAPILDRRSRGAHRRRDLVQAVALLVGAGGMVGLAAYIIWGAAGLAATAALLVVLYAVAPRIPPEALMRLYRATLVPPDQSQLSSLVDVLAYRAELTTRPQLYVIPSMTLTAFSAGTPGHAAIALTEGLRRRLTLREIAGVLAHEMSHIRNDDLRLMSLADLLTRILQLLPYAALGLAVFNVLAELTDGEQVSWWGILLLYIAPAVSSFIQLNLPRGREFDADLEAASLTGDPLGLASAMRRLETYTGQFWEDLMFPVPARRVPQPSLLRTHPPTETRVERLLSRDDVPRLEPIVIVEQPMMSLVGYGPGEMRPRYRWPGLWF